MHRCVNHFSVCAHKGDNNNDFHFVLIPQSIKNSTVQEKIKDVMCLTHTKMKEIYEIYRKKVVDKLTNENRELILDRKVIKKRGRNKHNENLFNDRK